MIKNLFILLILTTTVSCSKKKTVIFSNQNLIGEYSSTENGDSEFVIKKDESGYYLQQQIENGTAWSPRENLKEMTTVELTTALGLNWKKFTYAGLTSGICSYFKVSTRQNGVTAGKQPNTEYFSRCLTDNYFYKIKSPLKYSPKLKDTLQSANDTLLLTNFLNTLYNRNLTIENKINQIENIIKHLDNPNIELNGATFLNELIISNSSIKDLNTRIRIINTLISKGADVNMEAGTYRTPPLFQAEEAEIVAILLENGANPNYISDSEQTMFANYMTYDRLKIAKEYGFNFAYVSKKETLLHIATNDTQNCGVNSLDFLIKQIPEYINNYDNSGYAPIHYYARENFVDFYPLIEVLIKNGANPKIKTKKDSYYNEALIPKGSTPYEIINIVQNTYSNPSRDNDNKERNKVLELLK